MKKSHFFLLLVLILFLVGFTVSYIQYQTSLRSKASFADQLNIEGLSATSSVKDQSDVVIFNIYKEQGYLYKTTSTGAAGALEFVQENPSYTVDEVRDNSLFVLLGYKPGEDATLLPPHLIDNSLLVRSKDDRTDPYLTKQGITFNADHYYYNQTINDIPVYGAVYGLHIKNGNEIYGINGSIVKNTTVDTAILTQDQAKERALNEARKDAKNAVVVDKVQPYILNKKLLGLGPDAKNYMTLAVTVKDSAFPPHLNTMYFVDLSTGTILREESLLHQALNRVLYDGYHCSDEDDMQSCTIYRQEGQGPTGDVEVDKIYNYFGDVYTYYKNTFNRDSYDNQGSVMRAFPHIVSDWDCPNAAWLPSISAMMFCNGMAAKDVTAHELTHAVTQFTADLNYEGQAGALNESMSDMFAYALDPNWTFGEDTVLGIIRRMDDPTRPTLVDIPPQPDRLFSPNYFCPSAGTSCNAANDYCGVHQNNGVMNKTYYLMVAGGTFNGCGIAGLGVEKVQPIVYRALTTYLTQTSNFKNMYTAMMSACADIYQSASSECATVQQAFQATEMDQQPDGDQIGAKCSGQVAQPAHCQGSQPQITTTPIPTTPINLPTPTPCSGCITFTLSLKLPGIGSSENTTPQQNSRDVTFTLMDSQNNEVMRRNGTMLYNASTGYFDAVVDMGQTIPEGVYSLYVRSSGTLRKRAVNILTIATGQTTYTFTERPVLIIGNINNDDTLDVEDYNLFVDCFGAKKTNAASCIASDITSDNAVDLLDYKYFIQMFQTSRGD